MNNKGQTLVLFVILLPLFIIIGAYMVDSGYILIEKNKLDGVLEIAKDAYLEENLSCDEIKKLILKNDEIETINCDVSNGLELSLQTHIDSIFGQLIGYKDYEINSSIIIKN